MASSLHQLEVERTLVEAAQVSPGAFAVLYERYVDQLFAYVCNRVGDRTVAEDIVSETFHRAFEHLHSYHWRGVPFSAWLYRIAGNAIAAWYRRDPVPLGGDEELDATPGSEPCPETAITTLEWKAELLTAVRALPEDQQQVIVLRFGQELRSKEIALIMMRSEGAVKAILHRALATLHRRLSADNAIAGTYA